MCAEPSGLGSERRSLPDWAVAVLLAEFAAVLIAVLMPVTPSKTGSSWSLAEVLWPEPTYLQEVATYFVLTNVLILLIGLAVWVAARRNAEGGS